MAYTANQDLIDRVGGNAAAARLTSDSGATPDANKVTAAREGAEGVVNMHLSPWWQTPVDLAVNVETGQVMKKLVLDIAEHDLRSLRVPVPEDVVRSRNDAIKLLEKFGKGEASLPGFIALASPTNAGSSAAAEGAERVFSRDKMGGF